ncbi:hypothetical protein ABGB17_34935 [Sphaerisporangium sp. B11E5]|uniref:hypothetical protein n=1 Tax=Sphaerisporangium sp. B11E5 TaxID=3153563 RepID=UPI00325CF77C
MLAVVAGGGVAVWDGRGGGPPDGTSNALGPAGPVTGWKETETERRRIFVDLGDATRHAARITAGGVTRDLSWRPAGGPPGRPWADIDIARNTGGLAVVLDASDQPLAVVPIWSLPGFTPPRFVADCEAASIGQTLLTPWMTRPDALSVGFLDALARTGAAQSVVAQHSDLLCERLAEEPRAGGGVRPPDPRGDREELDRQAAVVCALQGQMADIAHAIDTGERPRDPGATATCARRPPRGGALALGARTARAARPTSPAPPGAGSCALPRWRFDAAASARPSPFTVCSDGVTTEVTNDSPSVAFFYEGGRPPAATLGAVPGETVIVPSLEKIVLAVLADAGQGLLRLARTGGCAALDLFDISFPPCQDPGSFTESQIRKLFEIIRPGGATIRTAPSYYSVAWGDETGVPAGFDLSRPKAYSRGLTFLNHAVLPIAGLMLNRDLALDLSSPDSPEKRVLLDRLAARVSVPLPGQGGDLGFLAGAVGKVLADPELLARLVVVFMPSSVTSTTAAVRWLRGVLGILKRLPVLGYVDLAFQVSARAAGAAEVVVSLVRLTRTGSSPAYVSWPARMTAQQAKALPAGACVPPYGLTPPVNAPGSTPLTCLTAVDADLDGDRATDRLVLWSAAGLPVRGTAYLATGHVRVWDPGTPSLPGGPALSAVADRLGDSPRQQFAVTVGGTSMPAGLSDEGTLQTIRYGNGHNAGRMFLVTPGGAGHHAGCVSTGTGRLLVTTLVTAEPYGVRSASFYYALRVRDMTLRLVGYGGGYSASPGGFEGDDCAKRQVPAATVPGGMARDSGGPLHHEEEAARAVDALFDAANAGRATRGAAFLGGTRPVPAFPGYTLGVWTLLRAAPAALSEAARAPAACAARVPRAGHPFLYCRVQSTRQAWDLQVTSTGDNYVVVAAHHRAW